MDVSGPLFTLLCLSNNVLNHVLRCMQHINLIGFSLCSERTKNLVKSIHLKTDSLRITVNRLVEFVLCFDGRSVIRMRCVPVKAGRLEREKDQQPLKLPATGSVHIRFLGDDRLRSSCKWRKSGFDVRDWTVHLLTSLNFLKIDRLCIDKGYELFELDSIRKTFDGMKLKEIWIGLDLSSAQANELALLTFPSVKRLTLCLHSKQDRESIYKILSQNYDIMGLGYAFKETLNELMTINSLNITSFWSTLSEKELNTFLKHWISGSNPRLKHMWICFKPDEKTSLDDKIVLKGINHQIVSSETERSFLRIYEYSDTPITVKLNGGFDIWRNDGTKATIVFKTGEDRYSIVMYIWNGSHFYQ